MSEDWQPIETAPDGETVDVWMEIPATPASMGWGDSFRVPDAYRRAARWFHREGVAERELQADYLTHWMPLPKAPA